MRKFITLFAAAYITLFSTTALNAQGFGDPQFCALAGSIAEEVQMHRQTGHSPQQIANRHAQYIGEAFSGRGNGAMRQRAANQMAQITKAIIEDDFFIGSSATTIQSFAYPLTIQGGQTNLSFDAGVVSQIKPNDTLICIQSDRVIETDDRGQARHGVVLTASMISSETGVVLSNPVPTEMLVGDSPDYSVTAISTSQRTITVAGLIGETVNRARYRVAFRTVGGAASTATLLPSEFDPATGKFTFASALPAGLVVGDTLYIRRQITVFVTHSGKVDIEGLTFTRPVTTDATAGDLGFRCLSFGRTYNARVRNIETTGFSESGIRISNSYGFGLNNHIHRYCNRSYNVSDGTGYGVSIHQSSFGKARDIVGLGCRRTLDVGGTQMVSHDNDVEEISGYSVGAGYTGDLYFPQGPLWATVTGSHGGAKATTYSEIRGANIYGIMNLRGMEETVSGLYGCGEISSMVNSFTGDGAYVEGVYYSSGRSGWVASLEDVSKYTLSGKLGVVLNINGRNIDPKRPHHLMDVVVRGLTESLINVQDGGNIGPITVGGNIDLAVDDERGDDPVFSVIGGSGPHGASTVSRIRLGAMSITNSLSHPKEAILWVHHGSIKSPNPMRLPNGTFFIELGDDAATQIDLDLHIHVVKVSLYCAIRNRPFKLVDGLVELGLAGNKNPVPASSGVDILGDVALTGTTGTDGNISISIPVAKPRKLHVENRYGSTQQFIIECDTAV